MLPARVLGKQVAWLENTDLNPRNGEGDFIQLKNGGVMFAFSEFKGQTSHDNATAYISAVFSHDKGETFGERRELFPLGEGDVNNMCVSLLRMNNGDIGIIYGVKYNYDNGNNMFEGVGLDFFIRRSSDEGKTWSERIRITEYGTYTISQHARVIRLKSGRILMPVNYYAPTDCPWGAHCLMGFYYSDDDGETWVQEPHRIENPVEKEYAGLQETGVIQYDNGTIMAYSRTCIGCQFVCYSYDDGLTWSPVQAAIELTSPESPMQIRRLNNDMTVAAYNPVPGYIGRDWERGRTPLICQVIDGDGSAILEPGRMYLYLEDDISNAYCYPSIFAGDDYFLVAYYHSNNGGTLSACKIKKIMYSEIERTDGALFQNEEAFMERRNKK